MSIAVEIEEIDRPAIMKTEYIIHADDFGHDSEVNACIDECFARKWLTETSLMVNMPGCDEAVALASRRGYRQCVGLHLNLTEGFPLTKKIRQCSRFCSPEGEFNRRFHMSIPGRFVFSAKETDAVAEEIEAQLLKFVSIGGMMMRIDSHHHSHTDWAVWRILKPIAEKYRFESMRISADLHPVGFLRDLYKSFFNAAVRRSFKTYDHFDCVGASLSSGSDGMVEIMTHPKFRNGIICDTDIPFESQIEKVSQVCDSTIRRWSHV